MKYLLVIPMAILGFVVAMFAFVLWGTLFISLPIFEWLIKKSEPTWTGEGL